MYSSTISVFCPQSALAFPPTHYKHYLFLYIYLQTCLYTLPMESFDYSFQVFLQITWREFSARWRLWKYSPYILIPMLFLSYFLTTSSKWAIHNSEVLVSPCWMAFLIRLHLTNYNQKFSLYFNIELKGVDSLLRYRKMNLQSTKVLPQMNKSLYFSWT